MYVSKKASKIVSMVQMVFKVWFYIVCVVKPIYVVTVR